MIVLSASELNKVYGTDIILQDVSFHLNEGDRTGIVGENGAGKSTLLNILTGEVRPDSGQFFIAGDKTTGYLKQRDNFAPGRTVIQEVNTIFEPLRILEREIGDLHERIAAANPSESKPLWTRLETLEREYIDKGGYTYKSEITGILQSMAFGEEYYDQPTGSLSGGERTRLALALLLLKKPDILILDEPTNHLDIGTLKWLEQYLGTYRGTILVVSHDRYFLDQLTDHILEVHDHKVTLYEGNYTEFADKKRAAHDAAIKAYNRQEAEIRRQEDMIRRYRERGTEKLAKRAASREKRLARIDRLEKPENGGKPMKISFYQDVRSGGDVLFAEDLSMQFGNRTLFKNVGFDIKRGERICIVGANGTGKTTLLRIITGEIAPTEGFLRVGYNVEFGYYDQGQLMLDDELTVMDEVHNEYILYKDREIRGLLGRFLFRGDQVFNKVGSLSGGEKARLALLKLMMSGANVLVLDEPTNHLDIESKEAFEDALDDYPGTVITVTHDRYFLNRIPDRILELDQDGISTYLGRYDYYVQKKAELSSGVTYLKQMADGEKASQPVEPKLSAADERELKKKAQAEERRREREIERLEALIERTESETADIYARMCDEKTLRDHVKLSELDMRMKELKEVLDNAYDEWEKLGG